VRPIERVAAQGSGHCSIGRDEGHIRSEAEVFQKWGSVGRPAAGGDGNGDPSALCGPERLGISRADGLAEGGQQSAVHVDRHEANGGVHEVSLRAGNKGTQGTRGRGDEGKQGQQTTGAASNSRV